MSGSLQHQIRAYLDLGRLDLAERLIRSGLESGGPDAQLLFCWGTIWLRRGQPVTARRLFRRAAGLDPMVLQTVPAIQAELLVQGPAAAEALMAEADQSLLPPGTRLLMHGLIHHERQRFDLEVKALQAVLAIDPDPVFVRERLANALLLLHRTAEAAPVIGGLMAEAPDKPEVLALASRLALQQHNRRAAREFAIAAMVEDPTSSEGRSAYAAARLGYTRIGRFIATLINTDDRAWAAALVPFLIIMTLSRAGAALAGDLGLPVLQAAIGLGMDLFFAAWIGMLIGWFWIQHQGQKEVRLRRF